MSEVNYTRYVAIGDNQTEGLWDGDDSVGVTGFADRLANGWRKRNPAGSLQPVGQGPLPG